MSDSNNDSPGLAPLSRGATQAHKIAFLQALGVQASDPNYERVLKWGFPEIVDTAITTLGVVPTQIFRVTDNASKYLALMATEDVEEVTPEQLALAIRTKYNPGRAAAAKSTFRLIAMNDLLANGKTSLQELVESNASEGASAESPIVNPSTDIQLPQPHSFAQKRATLETPPLKAILSMRLEKQAPFLLRHYRKRAGLSQEELAEKIGVPSWAIKNWEAEALMEEATMLRPLATALRLSNAETNHFTRAVLPALDKAWLQGQPEYWRAGLMHRDYRRREGISVNRLAEIFDLSPSGIVAQETGNRGIALKRFGDLTQVFNLSGPEMREFLPQVMASNVAISEKRCTEKAKVQLGVTKPTRRHPELSPDAPERSR